jgi:Tc5 transposase DNA-binding domain
MSQIEQALAYLKAQKKLSYAAAAKKFELEPTTLRRRYLGTTVSRAQARARRPDTPSSAQEKVLLSYIDKLTARHLSPTVQIVHNLAEELLDMPLGKNWARCFVKRNQHRICSKYLRPLDKTRIAATNIANFEHLYCLV